MLAETLVASWEKENHLTYKTTIIILLICVGFSCDNRTKEDLRLITKFVGQTSDKTPVYLELNSDKFKNLSSGEQIYKGFKLLKGNQTLYEDSTSRLEFDDTKINWISYKDVDYLVLVNWDPIDNSNHLIFQLKNDTVSVFSKAYVHTLEDYDNDGIVEVGGYRYLEGYCVDCDSMYYRPYHLFELTESVRYDSSASKKLTVEMNGVYFEDQKNHVIKKIMPATNNGEHP